MNAGDVFRFLNIAEKHVWMIISDPARDPAHVLMANFTTNTPYLDQACRVFAGEHPFIKHETVVNYARAKVVTSAALRWQTSTHGPTSFHDPQFAEINSIVILHLLHSSC